MRMTCLRVENSIVLNFIFGLLDQVVVEAVKALFGEEKEENLLASLTTIMNCCDGEKRVIPDLVNLRVPYSRRPSTAGSSHRQWSIQCPPQTSGQTRGRPAVQGSHLCVFDE